MNTYTIDQLLELEPPAWLVDDILPEGGLIALYGAPGAGKSFIGLDLALCVAAGVPWQGHDTRQGRVVYVSAEGGAGLGKRVGAWLQAHADLNREHILIHFCASTLRVYRDSDDLAQLLRDTCWSYESQRDDAMGGIGYDAPDRPTLVIIDTLARCFEGNENQQEDMNHFIQGLDQLREDGITVLVVHHTGKKGFEERGSNVFRGACDAMIAVRISEHGVRSLSCTKQKDAEEFASFPFALDVVPEWESCVVRTKDEPDIPSIDDFLAQNPEATTREIADAFAVSQSTATRRAQKYRLTQG